MAAPSSGSADLIVATTAASPAPSSGAVALDATLETPPPTSQPSPPTSAPAPANPSAPTDESLPAAAPSGPAVGGPKGSRPCEFHESVDSYQRLCTTSTNPDGSLHVVARGTKLNPNNGFEFTLHGGPHNFVAHGTLDAFYQCSGPFTAYVSTVVDKGVTTYELRFKEHCKIVVR